MEKFNKIIPKKSRQTYRHRKQIVSGVLVGQLANRPFYLGDPQRSGSPGRCNTAPQAGEMHPLTAPEAGRPRSAGRAMLPLGSPGQDLACPAYILGVACDP